MLASAPLSSWQVRWDDGETVVAVWLDPTGGDRPGRLSLFQVGSSAGPVDLAHPMLDAAPAVQGFSLRTGRLVWSEPGKSETLQVLTWSGATPGRIELPAAHGATVVP